jgi:hypothetical protein
VPESQRSSQVLADWMKTSGSLQPLQTRFPHWHGMAKADGWIVV